MSNADETANEPLDGSSIEPPAWLLIQQTQAQQLIDKGFTPHRCVSSGGMTGAMTGDRDELWWDKAPVNAFSWPMATTVIGFLLFVLLAIKGVPWS